MRCFSGAAGLACLGPPAVFKRPTVSCYCRCLPTACLITSVGPGELGRAVCVGGGAGCVPLASVRPAGSCVLSRRHSAMSDAVTLPCMLCFYMAPACQTSRSC